MIGEFLIALREGFEAALIVSIAYSYVKKIGGKTYTRYLWYGAVFAIFLGIFAGASVWILYGTLPRTTQHLFEVTSAWTAAAVLSSAIYWIATRAPYMRQDIERRVAAHLSRGEVVG